MSVGKFAAVRDDGGQVVQTPWEYLGSGVPWQGGRAQQLAASFSERPNSSMPP